jgi:chromosomal replication initiation ATPase DnaA
MSPEMKQALLAQLAELSDDERLWLLRMLQPQRVDLPQIEEDIAAWCTNNRTPVALMRGRSKTRTVVAIRSRLCLWLTEQGYSSKEIGRALHRDHTTILETLKRVRVAA